MITHGLKNIISFVWGKNDLGFINTQLKKLIYEVKWHILLINPSTSSSLEKTD